MSRSFRPDPDHDAACESPERHQVVEAPPGTGKTHLAVRLAGQEAASLPAHSSVLVLTFSNQARTQLEIAAADLLSSEVRSRIEVTNYHSFFWNAVWHYRRALNLPLDLEVVSKKRREAAIQSVNPLAGKKRAKAKGVLESLPEYAFPEFHDERTPPEAVLGPLLDAVRAEQHAGRLVYDDFGALFWDLLNRYPAIVKAYQFRFPIIIADEHQDASALQDAVVRRIATKKLVVLADPMQLIYGFRGASPHRLNRHLVECDRHHTLKTPHRWHGQERVGEWLLAVRRRLAGETVELSAPATLKIELTTPERGFIGTLYPTKMAILRLRASGCRNIAILVWQNEEAARLRGYLTKAGFFPRQIGSGGDFEEARGDIEFLRTQPDGQQAALHALQRIEDLVPGLGEVGQQTRRRLGANGVNKKGAKGPANQLLDALAPLYVGPPEGLFLAVAAGLNVCASVGLHIARKEPARVFRETADQMMGIADLEVVITIYQQRLLVASHLAPRLENGVYVMTVHQAKGKEFEAVVLVNASARNFPDTPEASRLFYVALTRAKSHWVIIAPQGQGSPLLETLR